MHCFPPFVAGNTNHSSLGNGRMADKGVLDFGSEDVLATADDHVLETIADVDEAIVVHVAAVTGMHPAAAKRLGGGLRFVPVTEHDVGATHQDFADCATGHFAILGIGNADFHAADGQPG
ncbi:hypothetical protein D3C78_1541240 [compost metagenome]